MSFTLPDAIASSQDLMALIIDVKRYTEWYRHESIKKQVNVSSAKEALQLSPVSVDVIRAWSSEAELTTQRLDELIANLEDYQKKAPTMNITLAAPASRGLKTAMVAWCRKNISPTVLVTFEFNATILGGMVVRNGSHVYDWSMRRGILENRAKLPEVLRSV